MPRSPFSVRFALAAIAVLFLAPAAARAQSRPPGGATTPAPAPADTSQPRFAILLEGAFVAPAADLPASFDATERGFSAGPGYAVGLRTRWYATPSLVISPAFHFAKLGEHEDYDAAGDRFHVKTSMVRFGLDLLFQAPGAYYQWRPFAGVGVELAQNRYQETFDVDESSYEATCNAVGPRVHAGVRYGDFQFSLSLHWSRFSTPRFFATDEDTAYRWDTAQLVLGYTLPRF